MWQTKNNLLSLALLDGLSSSSLSAAPADLAAVLLPPPWHLREQIKTQTVEESLKADTYEQAQQAVVTRSVAVCFPSAYGIAYGISYN